MVNCEYCGNKINELPRKCKYCGHYFCSNHRLPESHDCHGIKHYFKKERFIMQKTLAELANTHAIICDRGYDDIIDIESRNSNYGQEKTIGAINKEDFSDQCIPLRQKESRQPPKVQENYKKEYVGTSEQTSDCMKNVKSFLKRKYYTIKSNLNSKNHKSYHNWNAFLMNFLWIIIFSILFMIIFFNLEKLNKIVVWFLPIGSALLLVDAFLLIKYIWKSIKQIFYWLKGERNWVKYLIVIIFISLLWQGYQNRNTVFEDILSKCKSFEIQELLPINQEKIKHPLRNETLIELKIFELTNAERVKVGKSPLRWNLYLANTAKSHSEDMMMNNYFEHNNVNLGENIGEVPISFIPFYITVEGCYITLTNNQIASCHVDGWVNSPGHYSNMISSSYSEIGVGVDCNFFECKATQNFR